MASRKSEDIFPHAGGDHDNDDDEVGDIILDAGETDEQLVTSPIRMRTLRRETFPRQRRYRGIFRSV